MNLCFQKIFRGILSTSSCHKRTERMLCMKRITLLLAVAMLFALAPTSLAVENDVSLVETQNTLVAQADDICPVTGTYHAVTQAAVWCRGNAWPAVWEYHKPDCTIVGYYANYYGHCMACGNQVFVSTHLCYALHSFSCGGGRQDYCGL